MKNYGKKFISLLLSAFLMLSMAAIPAGAADAPALYTKTITFDGQTIDTLKADGWTFSAETAVSVDNGRLKFGKSNAYFTFPSVKGAIELEFDIQLSAYTSGYTQPLFAFWNDNSRVAGVFQYGAAWNFSTAWNTAGLLQNPDNSGGKGWKYEMTTPARIKLVVDTESQTYTAYTNGNQATDANGAAAISSFENTKDAVNKIYFNFTDEAGEVYIDNVTLTQTRGAKPTVASSVENGAKAVSRTEGIKLTFDQPMKEATLAGIKLYEGSETGTEVSVNRSISADKTQYTLTPATALKEAAKYVVVVPATVESELNSTVEKYTVSFTTRKNDTTLLVNENFENVSGSTPYELDASFAQKGTEITFYKQYSDYTWDSSDYDSSSGYYLAEDGSFSIANSMAKIVKSTSTDRNTDIYMYLKKGAAGYEKINEGVVKYSLDLIDSDGLLRNGYIQTGVVALRNAARTKPIVGLNYNAGNAYILSSASNAVNNTTLITAFKANGEVNKIELIADFDNDKAYVVVNGVNSQTVDIDSTYDGALVADVSVGYGKTTTGLYIDNVKIEQYKQPKIASSNVSNGAIGVSLSAPIKLQFNAPFADSELEKISLKKNGMAVSTAAVTPDADGYGITINLTESLDVNTVYTLDIPAITSLDGLTTAAETYTFTTSTSHALSDLKVSNYTITDGTNNVEKIEADKTIYVNADFTNESAEKIEDVVLVVALIDASGAIQNICYGTADIEAGNTTDVEASFKVPATIGENAYIKIFAWESLSSLVPINALIRFPAE